jgi:hypothetical protein
MVHGQITMDSAASQIFFSSCRGTKPYDENTGIHIKQRCKAIVTAIPAPTTDPISVNNCFEKVFEHELDNTKSIYKVVKWHSMKKIGLHGISYNGS